MDKKILHNPVCNVNCWKFRKYILLQHVIRAEIMVHIVFKFDVNGDTIWSKTMEILYYFGYKKILNY